jgi:hypothetical protein
MAIYAGGCTSPVPLSGACDDDSCLAEAAQAVFRAVSLTAGVTYEIVVWQYGLSAPPAGNTAVQLRVNEELAPPNDRCSGALPLLLNEPAAGTTVNAANDTQLPAGSTCFGGLGQTASTAPGGDVAVAFTAPGYGRYSFRVTGFETTKNAVIYAASDCPAGPAPATIASCLGAANRNAAYPGEEVYGLPLASGQTVYVYVDENAATTGSGFTLEATASTPEGEPNDTPVTAAAPACGLEGSIAPAGARTLSRSAPAGFTPFAMVDGAAITVPIRSACVTAADTLEYDDLDNDTRSAASRRTSPGPRFPEEARSGQPLQRPLLGAAPPVRRPAARRGGAGSAEQRPLRRRRPPYFAGTIAGSGDIDLFSFPATAGRRMILGLDLVRRDNTPWNGAGVRTLRHGAASVNDGDASSSIASGPAARPPR